MVRGANTTLDETQVQVRVAWRAGSDVDLCALLLGAGGKVRDDADFVFFNQPSGAGGAVELTADGITADLARLPSEVDRVVIAGAMDTGTFDTLPGLEATVTSRHGRILATFPLQQLERVAAVVFGELYRRNGTWKFRAVGQGWANGLAGLATSYGVAVDDEPADVPGDWRAKAADVLESTGPVGPRWDALWSQLRQLGVPQERGREVLRPLALHHLHRILTFAFADDLIEQHEVDEFEDAARRLGITGPDVDEMRGRMLRGLEIGLISSGKLPRVERTTLALDTDEFLHLEVPAVHIRALANGARRVGGRLIVTNRKLLFLGDTGGTSLSWSQVLEIRPEYTTVVLAATARRGAGSFEVTDPEYVAAVLTGAMRVSRRTATIPAQRDSRAISPAVRAEVWRRDGGACVECQATEYLEFDHVIPWSRGGATSTGNLQLLCRRCNLAKGARI